MFDIEGIIKRAKIAAGVKTNAELGSLLSIGGSAVSNWKASGTVNFDSLFRALPDASPSWILYGKGPMLLCDLDLLVAVDKSKEGNVRQIGISNDNSKNYGSDENSKAVIDELRENNAYLREQNKALMDKILKG